MVYDSTSINEKAVFASIQSSLAMILFDTEGRVKWVNENFANALSYTVDEIIGVHHRTFCLPEYVNSKQYEDLWDDLRSGKTFQDKIQRVAKDGTILILEASYIPVIEDDRVVEVVKVATDITKRELLIQSSTAELLAMVEEMTANTDEALQSTQKIAERMNDLNQESAVVKHNIDSIHAILSFVKNIASQSQLLGLNAAIESARAGEQGRGFAVVASEIRKMAESSQRSSEDISVQLTAISNSITSIMESISTITMQVNGNFQSMHELKGAFDHIAVTTENLAKNT